MVLVGNLKDLRLANIIQLNCMERNVAKVTVSSTEGTGFLYFAEGQIVHAEFSPYIGEKAVYEMLSLNDGQFKVEAGVHAPTQTIKRPWNSVVLDSLRELDEKSEKITSITKKVFSILSGQKGVQNIYLLDFDGNIIEGKANEKTNPKVIVFIWYKLKKMLSLFYADSFHYTFLRDRWGYVFIIEFQGSLIVIETDLNTVVEDFISLIYKLLKGVG